MDAESHTVGASYALGLARCCQLGPQMNHKPTTRLEKSDGVRERKWLIYKTLLVCPFMGQSFANVGVVGSKPIARSMISRA